MSVLSQKYGTILKGVLEVIPKVYQLTIGGVNMILIAEEELTLIDTGFRGSSAHLIDLIHRVGRSVEEIGLIILTHNHYDHAGGLTDLNKLIKAKVAAHKADIADVENQRIVRPSRTLACP
ncbi:MBL fold metallo-hydrolase [Chloroflexota bacterium]